VTICDPSDQNESHVGKLITFLGKQQNVYGQMSAFAHFQT